MSAKSNFKKFVKISILIGMSSNFLHNIRTCTVHVHIVLVSELLYCSVSVSVSSEPTEEERRLQRKDERNKSRMKIYDLDWTLVSG